MSKVYSSHRELQEKILTGVNALADNVACTLGPKGRNVILAKKGSNPIITKDGVTVAKFVDLKDPFENAGANILKQVASETNSLAGDGTTTSTVLARDIVGHAQKYIVAGSSPVDLKRGMDKACRKIALNIAEMSKDVTSEEDVQHVATVSANGDSSVGKLVAMAVDRAGHNGSISVEDAKSMDTTLDLIEGFTINSGYFARAFVNNERKASVEYDDPLVLVTDHKIESVQTILPMLELVSRDGRPFVIVAEEVEGQALAALIMNAVRGTMKVAAIKAPGYGESRRNALDDLAVSVGATFISRLSGKKLEEAKLSDLGTCKKVSALKSLTTFVGGQADFEVVDERIESIKSEIAQTKDASAHPSSKELRGLEERLARLSSGVAVIKVGGATEVEMIEKKHRIEDAIEAVKAAQEGGIVPGGGTALLRCRDFKIEAENEDQALGAEIIRKSLEAPIRQMAANAGHSGDLIINSIESKLGRKKAAKINYGWDFASDKMVDMLDTGIIDPAKVTTIALRNAVSAASTLLTTNHAIIEE